MTRNSLVMRPASASTSQPRQPRGFFFSSAGDEMEANEPASTVVGGITVTIAESPADLLAFAPPHLWKMPKHWGEDVEQALEAAWPNAVGLMLEGGGAILLENLGDGVSQMIGALAPDDECAGLKLQAAIILAFCGTECRRLLSTAPSEEGAVVARQFGFYRYLIRNDGSGEATHYLAAELDEWAAAFGHELFHSEAVRLGREEKAVRVLQRWAMHQGDTSALDIAYLQATDPKRWVVDAAVVKAVRAGFRWQRDTPFWLEHAGGCGFEAGECTCMPIVGFSNGEQAATVDPANGVHIAGLQ